MFYQPTNYPDIILGIKDNNPVVMSPNSDYSIEFAMTREGSYDLEEYKEFLDSAIRTFRHSRTYTHYKAYLYNLGLDTCIFHPYIQTGADDGEIATLEMHHCMLNIYQIALLISEHILNTYGQITEYDLVELLKYEHVNNNIPIVMLCKTCHQLYHHKYLYVPVDRIFGQWWNLLSKYNTGLQNNIEISNNLIRYIEKTLNDNKLEYESKKAKDLLQLRDNILSWSNMMK